MLQIQNTNIHVNGSKEMQGAILVESLFTKLYTQQSHLCYYHL